MIKEEFFPTIIYGFDVKLDNDKLAQDILEWSKHDKGVHKTNVQGWHSQTDMQTKPKYKHNIYIYLKRYILLSITNIDKLNLKLIL